MFAFCDCGSVNKTCKEYFVVAAVRSCGIEAIDFAGKYVGCQKL